MTSPEQLPEKHRAKVRHSLGARCVTVRGGKQRAHSQGLPGNLLPANLPLPSPEAAYPRHTCLAKVSARAALLLRGEDSSGAERGVQSHFASGVQQVWDAWSRGTASTQCGVQLWGILSPMFQGSRHLLPSCTGGPKQACEYAVSSG